MPYPTSVNLLPAGRTLVLTADAWSSGELQWQDSTETATSVGASTVQRLGPFEISRQYTLTHITGTLVDTQEFSHFESGVAGMNCNLTTVPADANLTIPPDSQCVIHEDLTVLGNLDVDGVLKII